LFEPQKAGQLQAPVRQARGLQPLQGFEQGLRNLQSPGIGDAQQRGTASSFVKG